MNKEQAIAALEKAKSLAAWRDERAFDECIEILRALPDETPTVQRWTLDKILSVLDYATTHNKFATLTPAQVIAECVNLFTDFDGPGSPVFPDGPVVVVGPVECPTGHGRKRTQDEYQGWTWGATHGYSHCPDCGTRLQGGENEKV